MKTYKKKKYKSFSLIYKEIVDSEKKKQLIVPIKYGKKTQSLKHFKINRKTKKNRF